MVAIDETQRTPLPAAASCAVVERVIGVPDGVAVDEAFGDRVGAPVLVIEGVAMV